MFQKYRVGSENRISGVLNLSVYREECKTIALYIVIKIVMHRAGKTSLSLTSFLAMRSPVVFLFMLK